jgi:hypothetical protein
MYGSFKIPQFLRRKSRRFRRERFFGVGVGSTGLCAARFSLAITSPALPGMAAQRAYRGMGNNFLRLSSEIAVGTPSVIWQLSQLNKFCCSFYVSMTSQRHFLPLLDSVKRGRQLSEQRADAFGSIRPRAKNARTGG